MQGKNTGRAAGRRAFLPPTKNAGEELDAAELTRADAFCEEYKTFLDHAKIEREAVRTTVAMLEKAGYVLPLTRTGAISPATGSTGMYGARQLILATIGTEDLEKGVRMVISHIDSPGWTSSPIRSMRTAVWHSSRPTTMAASGVSVDCPAAGSARHRGA